MVDEISVLLVLSSEDDGGLGRVAATLAVGLASRGVRIAVALQRQGRIAARLAAARIPTYIVPDLLETLDRTPDGRHSPLAVAGNLARLPRAVGALRRLARAHGAHVLYSHGSWPNHLAAEATRGLPGIGAVWHVHTAFSRANHAAATIAARRGDLRRIIGVSETTAAPYRTLGAPVDVIYNGMPLDVCAAAAAGPILRQRLGIPADAFVFGYAGRLVEHKGIHVLVDAAMRVLREVADAHVVILGGTPRSSRDDVLAQLRARFAVSSVAARAHLPGHVDDVLRWIGGCDAAIVPSTYPDPCPLALLEALALGVPVIASRVGGIPELVDDGVDGVLVPPGDPAPLADAMIGLAHDRRRRCEMGRAARLAALARFDERTMIERVASALDAAVASRVCTT